MRTHMLGHGQGGAYGHLRMVPVPSSTAGVGCIELPARSELSEDQLAVFQELECWAFGSPVKTRQKLLTLGGYAGTGKTTLLSLLGVALARSGQRVAYVAYTGKAATVLRRKLLAAGVLAYVGTIHSLLYEPIIDELTKRVVGWQKVDRLPYDCIVLDEASMVGGEIFADLSSFGVPILAVGDHGQLPPIHGSFNLMEAPHLRLEQIHRQAVGSPILALSAYVREHGGLPRRFDGGDSVFLWDPSDLSNLIASTYTSTDGVRDIGTVCYLNRTRCALNNMVREHFQVGQSDPVLGEWLICLKNTRFDQVTVSNGQRAQVLSTQPVTGHLLPVELLFPDEGYAIETCVFRHQFGQQATFQDLQLIRDTYEVRAHEWSELGMLCDYGYALTCHKSQGDQWDKVLVVIEFPNRVEKETIRRWVYTAITRSSRELHLVVGARGLFV